MWWAAGPPDLQGHGFLSWAGGNGFVHDVAAGDAELVAVLEPVGNRVHAVPFTALDPVKPGHAGHVGPVRLLALDVDESAEPEPAEDLGASSGSDALGGLFPDLGLFCASTKMPYDVSGTGTFKYYTDGYTADDPDGPVCKYIEHSAGELGRSYGLPSYFLRKQVPGTWEEACDSSYGPQSYAVVTPYPLFTVSCQDPSMEFYLDAQSGG